MIRILIMLFAINFLLTACSTNQTTTLNNEKKNKTAEINIQLGMNYLQRQDNQRAKRKLLLALEQAPQLPEAWYSMGYFLESTGNSKEAYKYYLKAVELDPKRGDVQNNLGTFLCRKGEYKQAIEHFQMAVVDPDYLDIPGAYENAGLCALKVPDQKLAIHCFKLALAQDPNRTVSENKLAKLSLPGR